MNLTPESVRQWAGYAGDSPLYVHLSEVIAGDDDLLRVLNRIEHKPAPNILFAAVQLLLSGEPGHELSAYYPNLAPRPFPLERAGEPFRRFVLDRESEIVAIGKARYTQTNEARRCVALLPAVWEAPFDRFHLVDVGTSAGLNLALDRYRYRWGDSEWGPDSPVVLTTESRGMTPRARDVEVLSRVGIDLNPIDPEDPVERLWLESLVWPEHHERRDRLRASLQVARSVPIDFVAGDALTALPGVYDRLPAGEAVVVMDSFVLNQLTDDLRQQFEDVSVDERRRRPVHRVSLEPVGDRSDASALTVDSGHGPRQIGWAHHHGEWLDLYARP